MRYAIIIPDGAADRARPELDGRTPLQAANMPALKKMAQDGIMLRAQTVPEGYSPGSDVCCLSVLGYNPGDVYTGRAPLEAAAMNITLTPGQAVYRANTVTVADGTMKDYAAGHITTEEARELVEYVDSKLDIPGVKLWPGVQYRHACVVDGAGGNEGETTPPHDILDQNIKDNFPNGGVAEKLCQVMERTREFLKDHPVNAARVKEGKNPVTQLWLWGGGTMPELKSYKDLYGLQGGLISAVDLLRGIAILAGLEVVNVQGATGFYDTNYAGKGEAALQVLENNNFVAVHVEAPDEASHNANLEEKLKALENIDRHIITPLFNEAQKCNDLRLMVMPDHATPIELRTHAAEPVPSCLWGPGINADESAVFSEASVADKEPVAAHTLLARLLSE